MVDLHHHLLPGLDDGSPDLETSVAMARAAAADGITHVVCTSHANDLHAFDPLRVAERLETLRTALAAESIALTLGSGCDFHLSYDNIQDALANPRKYTINATSYLLVELPDHTLSPNLAEIFYELRLAGMTPILTHPERNPALQRNPALLADWMRAGLLTQITTSSLLGKMGRTAQRMAQKLLDDRWVQFVSTDAHNLTSRPPLMRQACELIAESYDPATAERLCVTNPLAVFEGRPLIEQPAPLNLYDQFGAANKVSWLRRLLGRR